MSIIITMRKQQCVKWALTGTSKMGAKTYAEPVQMKCRWDEAKVLHMSREGDEAHETATVYPEEAAGIGDLMALGTLADYEEAGSNPRTDHRVRPVLSCRTVNNKRQTQTMYIVKVG
jgi:hypothetical protein